MNLWLRILSVYLSTFLIWTRDRERLRRELGLLTGSVEHSYHQYRANGISSLRAGFITLYEHLGELQPLAVYEKSRAESHLATRAVAIINGANAVEVASGSRRISRSRRSRVLAGACGGIGEATGIDPRFVRLAFLALTFFGGLSFALYIAWWIVVPLEEDSEPGVGALTKGILVLGGAISVLLALADGMSTGGLVVAAPMLLAAIASVVRVDTARAKASLLLVGMVLTAVLAAVNYDPTFGNRAIAPRTPADLDRQYTNAFGTMTIDLTAFDSVQSNGLRIRATAGFGDVVVRLPENADVRINGTVLAGDVEALGSRIAHLAAGIDFENSRGQPLLIEIDYFGAFGSLRVER